MGRRKIRGTGTVIQPYAIPVEVADLEKADSLMQAGFNWAASQPEGIATDVADGSIPRYVQAGFKLIREYCGTDEAKFKALTTRVLALARVLHSEKMANWIATSNDNAPAGKWHPAILDVAASMQIRVSGSFEVTLFRNEVRRVGREKYPPIRVKTTAAE